MTCHPGGKRWPDAAGPSRPDAACVTCHEFPFPSLPGEANEGPPRLMQKTASEHRDSSAAKTSCVTCHMGRVTEPGSAKPHVDHRFLASRSTDAVRRAAVVDVRRDGGAVTFTFTRRAVGHAFPTGDIFRRLRVVVESEGAKRSVTLSRKTKEGSRDEAETDTRPFADGRDVYVVVVPLDGLSGELGYRVIYERVAHPTSLDESSAQVDGAIEIARGTLR